MSSRNSSRTTAPTLSAGSLISTNGSFRPDPNTRRCPMLNRAIFGVLLVGVLAVGISRPAHAQFAVIDIASVTQLVSEVQQLEQQVATARSQLAQAQSEYAAITGGR